MPQSGLFDGCETEIALRVSGPYQCDCCALVVQSSTVHGVLPGYFSGESANAWTSCRWSANECMLVYLLQYNQPRTSNERTKMQVANYTLREQARNRHSQEAAMFCGKRFLCCVGRDTHHLNTPFRHPNSQTLFVWSSREETSLCAVLLHPLYLSACLSPVFHSACVSRVIGPR